jgi:hypothetical protein
MILGDRRLCHDRLGNVVPLVEEDSFVADNRLGDVVMNVTVAAMAEDKGAGAGSVQLVCDVPGEDS